MSGRTCVWAGIRVPETREADYQAAREDLSALLISAAFDEAPQSLKEMTAPELVKLEGATERPGPGLVGMIEGRAEDYHANRLATRYLSRPRARDLRQE